MSRSFLAITSTFAILLGAASAVSILFRPEWLCPLRQIGPIPGTGLLFGGICGLTRSTGKPVADAARSKRAVQSLGVVAIVIAALAVGMCFLYRNDASIMWAMVIGALGVVPLAATAFSIWLVSQIEIRA